MNKWISESDKIIIDTWLNYKSKATLKSIDDIKTEIKGDIVSKVYADEEFKQKIKGMLYRNNISAFTNIGEDVMAEVIIQLMKVDFYQLFSAYCESYKRIFALSIVIAKRAGFGKMNADIHPNASVAKQILYKSNLNSYDYFCTTEEVILTNDGEKKKPLLLDLNEDIWQIIRSNLTQEEETFLDFLLDNVLNKKYSQSYSRKLRETAYSYNEYRILRLALQEKIKKIIQNESRNN